MFIHSVFSSLQHEILISGKLIFGLGRGKSLSTSIGFRSIVLVGFPGKQMLGQN